MHKKTKHAIYEILSKIKCKFEYVHFNFTKSVHTKLIVYGKKTIYNISNSIRTKHYIQYINMNVWSLYRV